MSEDKSSRGIQSVDIAASILEAIAGAGAPAMLKDIAARARLAPSKVHPYLVSLMRAGLVQKEAASGCYELGPMAIRLGMSALRGLRPVKLAAAALPAFAREINHTVALAVWGNFGPSIVQIEESSHPIHVDMRLGTVMSILGSATGRVFAAYLPEPRVAAALAAQDAGTAGPARTPAQAEAAALAKLRALRPELDRVAAEGLARAEGLAIPWINSLSAAVFDATGSLCMAVTALGPAADIALGQDAPLPDALKRFARRLSALNGYLPDGVWAAGEDAGAADALGASGVFPVQA